MAEVLCVYRKVKVMKEAAAKDEPDEAVAVISYDEKPGIPALATTAQTCRPSPACMQRLPAITNTSAMAPSP
jgi:phage I-like protein